MQTHSDTQWALGETKRTSGTGPLCSPGWLHAYEHPLLAVLHNPIHASITSPRLFEADTGDGGILRDGKVELGSSEMTITRELVVPEPTTEQRVGYAIVCALHVYMDEEFVKWAHNWHIGTDRSAWTAAEGAAYAAAWAAYAAAWAAKAVEGIDLVACALEGTGWEGPCAIAKDVRA
jgi:hypothetical protein